MTNVNLTIDERPVSVPAGTLVVDAAKSVGIDIPIFCSHSRLDPLGACRMCLVEIGDARGQRLQTACTVPVAEGMIVRTRTKQVKDTQEATLAFLLINHPLDCPICDKGGECPLQDQTFQYGPGASQFIEPKRRLKKNYPISDFILLDQERCILCWRCIRYLDEWEDKSQLGLFERAGASVIDIFPNRPVDAKTSGNIIDLCPVGALTSRVARFRFRPWRIEPTETICTHCAVGCNVRADVRHNSLRRVMARENVEVNDQWICDKGRFVVDYVNSDARLMTPLVRRTRGGELAPATWPEALSLITERLSAIVAAKGPDAVGGIGSAKLPNEANYLLQKFMRTIIGTNNVDHRDGAAVAATSHGIPAIRQMATADAIVLFGFDPSEEAPILDLDIKRAARRRGVKLLIAHPRQIELTRYPGSYLGYRPGSEAALLHGLIRTILANKWANESVLRRVGNFAQLAGWVEEMQPDAVTALAGVRADDVKAAAQLLVQAKNPVILFGPLLTRGPDGESILAALQNLVYTCGHGDRLGFVGLEANSQGARDVGLLPNQLPGPEPLDSAGARERLTRVWGAAPPTQPGLSYAQMVTGGVRALYVMGADPAAESSAARRALPQLDFLVVQDLFLSDTAKLADVVLPAASSFMETDGTYTNLEGRMQRVLPGDRPRGEAVADWSILLHLARAWPQPAVETATAKTKGQKVKGKASTRRSAVWDYSAASAVLTEIARVVPAYADLSWDALGSQGQPGSVKPSTNRRFQAVTVRTAGHDGAFPLALVSGTRLFDGGALLRASDSVAHLTPAPFVGLHPNDMQQLALNDGQTTTVSSPQGQVSLVVRSDESVRPGTAWVPWGQVGEPAGVLLADKATINVKVG